MPTVHPTRHRTKLRQSIVAATVLASLSLVHACATPTQVTVVITTNFPCKQLSGVTITVGPGPQAVEDKVASRFVTTKTQGCDSDHLVGSLVVTPGQTNAAIVVAASLAGDPVECVPPLYKGCIVARRSFSFVDHVALTIPIELDEQCKNIPCESVTTCTTGRCVPALVSCDESGCAGFGATPDGGADSDGSFADATGATETGSATDATLDASTDPDVDASIVHGEAGVMGSCVGDAPNCGAVTCATGEHCCHPPAHTLPGRCVPNSESCKSMEGTLCCTDTPGCAAYAGTICCFIYLDNTYRRASCMTPKGCASVISGFQACGTSSTGPDEATCGATIAACNQYALGFPFMYVCD